MEIIKRVQQEVGFPCLGVNNRLVFQVILWREAKKIGSVFVTPKIGDSMRAARLEVEKVLKKMNLLGIKLKVEKALLPFFDAKDTPAQIVNKGVSRKEAWLRWLPICENYLGINLDVHFLGKYPECQFCNLREECQRTILIPEILTKE